MDLHSVFFFEGATKDFTLKRENPCASLKISFYRDMICLERKYCKFLSEFTKMYGMIVLHKESMAINNKPVQGNVLSRVLKN